MRDGKKVWREVLGTPVIIKGFEYLDLFVHVSLKTRPYLSFTISESISGMALCMAMSARSAIDLAEHVLHREGKEQVERDMNLARLGIGDHSFQNN